MNKQVKRINKEHLFLFTSASVCIAFMAFVVMVFPAVKMSVGEESYKVLGTLAVFGGKLPEDIGIFKLVLEKFSFSFLSLIAYTLPLFSVVISVKAFKTTKPMLNYLAAFLCFVAAVMMLFQPVYFRYANDLVKEVEVSLLIGPIFGIICSLVSGFCSLGCVHVKNV